MMDRAIIEVLKGMEEREIEWCASNRMGNITLLICSKIKMGDRCWECIPNIRHIILAEGEVSELRKLP